MKNKSKLKENKRKESRHSHRYQRVALYESKFHHSSRD